MTRYLLYISYIGTRFRYTDINFYLQLMAVICLLMRHTVVGLFLNSLHNASKLGVRCFSTRCLVMLVLIRIQCIHLNTFETLFSFY